MDEKSKLDPASEGCFQLLFLLIIALSVTVMGIFIWIAIRLTLKFT